MRVDATLRGGSFVEHLNNDGVQIMVNNGVVHAQRKDDNRGFAYDGGIFQGILQFVGHR